MFSSGYGFVVDYLAEILRSLRNHDYFEHYYAHCSLSADISTRDREGIYKSFSGLMKILFPHGEAKAEETEELLRFAIEGRKRVKDQLLRLDSTYVPVRFAYLDEVSVHLITIEDEYKGEQQQEIFAKMQASAAAAGLSFTWEYDKTRSMHARHIITDQGWKIALDRGLDVFQHYEMNDAFAFANRLQEHRACKAFEVTFIKGLRAI